MRALSRRFLALLVVVALTGCASNRQPRQQAGVVAWPDSPAQDQTLLFFYTRRGDTARFQPTIYVDDVKVFVLPGYSHSWCYVKPGMHTVRASWEPFEATLNMHRRHLFTPGGAIYLKLWTDRSRGSSTSLLYAQMSYMDPVIAKLETEGSTYRPALVPKVDLP